MLTPPRSRGLRQTLAATSVAVAAMSLSACTSDSDGKVVVGFYPLEFLASSIGGDVVEIENLAQPGAEPHDMELTAQQVGAVESASLVIHQRGLQPAVDDVLDNQDRDHVLDVATVVDQPEADAHEGETAEEHAEHAEDETGLDDDGHGHDGTDPHVWLDPMLMKSMAEAVKDEMAEVDPENEDVYVKNYDTLAAELDALDEEFTTGLAQCQRTEFVTTHTAFGYLAEAYGLEQVGILGLSAEEPSPQKLAEVEKFVTEHGVTTIFFESGVSDDYAATVADATGAETAVLTPLETAPQSGDYISAMQQNLQALRSALGCA